MQAKPREECGVFAACLSRDAAPSIYHGLLALQHRGQESAGIAVSDPYEIRVHKGMGLVTEVFAEKGLDALAGATGIGHVRYSTTGASDISNAQPLVFRYFGGMMAVAHNGNLTNARSIRDELGRSGAVFQSTSDTEVIGCLIARYNGLGMAGAVQRVMETIRGAYSMVVLHENAVFAARDPYGFRPMVLGSSPEGHFVASESCALDTVGATLVRPVEPGEVVMVTQDGFRTMNPGRNGRRPHSVCVFEYIYFARPDSVIDGIAVARARQEFGRQLARESVARADIVVPVPESGVGAAMGYSMESRIPYDLGLIKNQYTGRTFIRPHQAERDNGVKTKLNAVESLVWGKRVVLVDDSIVRGTTSSRLVDLMRKAGATRVHLAVSSPPVTHCCYYGIDTGRRGELIAAVKSHEEICRACGADTLQYLSMEGMLSALERVGGGTAGFCMACFSGDYPESVECSVEPIRVSAYADAGVDIDSGNRAVDLIKPLARRTFNENVIGGLGGFGGLFSLSGLGMADPVLVAGADGVGTKLKIAQLAGVHHTVGIDLVAMCVNDVLTQGAKPIFFLDYVALGRLDPKTVASIVAGVAEGCIQAGCVLLGGETAEMPGCYPDGEYDLAGFAVGAVDRAMLVDGRKISEGDSVIGLASSGIHSNGYSLVRKILLEDAGLSLHDRWGGDGSTLAQILLEPTRIYVRPVQEVQKSVEVLGMAHITGGGLVENPPRMLPQGLSMELSWGSWPVPEIFQSLQCLGGVDLPEMVRVFNMGLGYLIVVRPDCAERTVSILSSAGQDAYIIGRIVKGTFGVEFLGVST